MKRPSPRTTAILATGVCAAAAVTAFTLTTDSGAATPVAAGRTVQPAAPAPTAPTAPTAPGGTREVPVPTRAVPDPVRATVTPSTPGPVGVGMPVSVTFDRPVLDQRAVQEAITVTSSGGQPVVGHWFGASRLDFRPESYWKPGSTVDVRLALAGVPTGPGAAGVQDASYAFSVGRSQISTVDAGAQTMTVVRAGNTLRTLPVSAGSPEHPTYDGTMVISSKSPTTAMNGATVGLFDPDGAPAYDIPDVPHAMRLTTSGTFVHGNYWAPAAVFGNENTSHGCIGLRDVQGPGRAQQPTPAAWFYDNSLVGDVVIVKDSGGRAVKPDNGLSDWNLNWTQWKQGSALG